MLDTLNPIKDTSDLAKFSFTSLFSLKRLVRVLKDKHGFAGEGGGEGGGNGGEGGGGGAGNFYDGFAPELKNNPTIQKYKSVEELAKGHVELQAKMGMKGVIVPTEGASEETIKEFHKAIGVPAEASAYVAPTISDLHEQAVLDAEGLKAFQGVAHKAGLNPKQFTQLTTWYLNDISAKLKAYDDQLEQDKNEAATALRQKWGPNYETKLALANKIIKQYAGEKAQDFLDKGEGNNPILVELLATIGEHLSEDALGKLGVAQAAMSVEEAKQKISEIRSNPKHPYHNDADPAHKEAIDYVGSLYKIAHPK